MNAAANSVFMVIIEGCHSLGKENVPPIFRKRDPGRDSNNESQSLLASASSPPTMQPPLLCQASSLTAFQHVEGGRGKGQAVSQHP